MLLHIQMSCPLIAIWFCSFRGIFSSLDFLLLFYWKEKNGSKSLLLMHLFHDCQNKLMSMCCDFVFILMWDHFFFIDLVSIFLLPHFQFLPIIFFFSIRIICNKIFFYTIKWLFSPNCFFSSSYENLQRKDNKKLKFILFQIFCFLFVVVVVKFTKWFSQHCIPHILYEEQNSLILSACVNMHCWFWISQRILAEIQNVMRLLYVYLVN